MSDKHDPSHFEFEHLFARKVNGAVSDGSGNGMIIPAGEIADMPANTAGLESVDTDGNIFEDGGMLGGYFDQEGNRLDPDSVPRPGLCICCADNDSVDSGKEILCNLTRLEQRDEPEFRCGSFVPSET